MIKKIMLTISAIILTVIMAVSLVACTYTTEDILSFKIDYLKADSKVETFADNILAIDDGNMYWKVGKKEIYVMKNGETGDVYTTLDGIEWEHENMPLEECPNNGLSDSNTDAGELEDEIEVINEGFGDFANNFYAGNDGFWYDNDDAAKVKGYKIDGDVCITKTLTGEKREQIGYSIVIPFAAKLVNDSLINRD